MLRQAAALTAASSRLGRFPTGFIGNLGPEGKALDGRCPAPNTSTDSQKAVWNLRKTLVNHQSRRSAGAPREGTIDTMLRQQKAGAGPLGRPDNRDCLPCAGIVC